MKIKLMGCSMQEIQEIEKYGVKVNYGYGHADVVNVRSIQDMKDTLLIYLRDSRFFYIKKNPHLKIESDFEDYRG